jgi:iron complex outermembrane receptor protein
VLTIPRVLTIAGVLTIGRALRLALGLTLCVAGAARATDSSDLTSLSLEQLLKVTVVGASKYEQKQSDVAAAVSVVTRQEIQSFGWHTLADALASLPGVYTTYDRQYSYIGVRGFGLPGDLNTRVLLTINGNRVNDPTFDQAPTGPEFPVDMDMIERIEYIPGPGAAVYGQNATLGVINVVTRTGADLGSSGLGGAELSATYEEPQTLTAGRASVGHVFDNGLNVLVSGTDLYSRGENRFYNFGASGISGVAVGMDGERNQQFLVSAALGPWTLEQVYGDHLKYDPTGAYLSDPLVPGQFQSDRHAMTQLRFEDSFAGDTLQFSGRAFESTEDYRSLFSFSGVPTYAPSDSTWRGGELRLLVLGLSGHKLMVGLEGQDSPRENEAVLNLLGPTATYVLDLSGYRVGVYIQDEWRLAPRLTATLGLREDQNSTTGWRSSPRAGLIWQTTPQTTLKALYGNAYRPPNVFERDYSDGQTQVSNFSLKGETIDTLELVADQRIGRDLTVRASLYQWTLKDLITLGIDPVTGLSQFQTGPTAQARGVELSGDRTWESGARLRGSLSIQEASYLHGGDLLNSPKRLGKLELSAPLPFFNSTGADATGANSPRANPIWANLRAGYEMRYDSRRLTDNGTELGGYVVSNLILSTDTLVRGLKVFLGFYNLFDKRYAQPAAVINWQNSFEQDGRSVQIKLSYGF